MSLKQFNLKNRKLNSDKELVHLNVEELEQKNLLLQENYNFSISKFSIESIKDWMNDNFPKVNPLKVLVEIMEKYNEYVYFV